MKRWIFLFLALIVGIAIAQERQPERKAPASAKTYKQGTPENPIVVKRLDAEETPERRAQMSAERDEKAANERSLVGWTIALSVGTLVLSLIALGQLTMFWKQLKLMREGTDDAKTVALAAKASAEAARTQTNALMSAERAYVKMSHTEAGLRPGIISTFTTEIKIENFGRTPAEIVDVVLNALVLDSGTSLPTVPKYQRQPGQPSFHALLVAGESFTVYPEFRIAISEQAAVTDGTKTFYVLGYVDYIDKFKQAHRGGYARKYDHRLPAGTNNLVFVVQDGYNYDRPRKEDERND